LCPSGLPNNCNRSERTGHLRNVEVIKMIGKKKEAGKGVSASANASRQDTGNPGDVARRNQQLVPDTLLHAVHTTFGIGEIAMKIYRATRVNAAAIALFSLIGFMGACDSDKSDETGECASLYWFDDETTECAQKEFCGDYMYESLRTFDTLQACEAAISAEK
ncbi:MAG: hypothetical protein MUC50_23460, partial [Myxococcota bacterium]|nr:hypothetical protein [Myxococcota bacterium]